MAVGTLIYSAMWLVTVGLIAIVAAWGAIWFASKDIDRFVKKRRRRKW